jgi:hypothetical protein
MKKVHNLEKINGGSWGCAFAIGTAIVGLAITPLTAGGGLGLVGAGAVGAYLNC